MSDDLLASCSFRSLVSRKCFSVSSMIRGSRKVFHRVALHHGNRNHLVLRVAVGSNSSNFHWQAWPAAAAALLAVGLSADNVTLCEVDANEKSGVSFETGQVLTNWSATHTSHPRRVYEPKSAQEVSRVLESHHASNTKIRAVGTALSPNGIGLGNHDLLSLTHLDYVEVDKERSLVTVGAGAKVADVLKELGKFGLTLENFSSIQEQQVGGWTQVAAHGTGCTLPTVEEMIVRMKLATPTEGLLTLSDTLNPRLFRMAKAGLGSLGVVTELTLRCVPSHKLLEYTFTTPSNTLQAKHYELLSQFRHVRYMWLPYTDKTVVVVSNPTAEEKGRMDKRDIGRAEKEMLALVNKSRANTLTTKSPTEDLMNLLLSLRPELTKAEAQKLSFTQLRDQLLAIDPLNVTLVKKINNAEALFWERSAGFNTDDSTKILGFDCGGEQWVLEVGFPIGTLAEHSGKDLKFVQKLVKLIEDNRVPAPCPIEQRWTARSTSPMSPAFSTKADEVFSWVGVIMYLPPDEAQRQAVTEQFRAYGRLMQPLLDEFGAQVHWAKLEAPAQDTDEDKARYASEVSALQKRVAAKYPVKEFNEFRDALDPRRILSNDLIETIFGK